MPTVVQRDFSAGELEPALHSRSDLELYSKGLRTCKNFIVDKQGALRTRAGTRFVTMAGDQTTTQPVRLIPFVFNDDNAYILELGHQYIRIIQNGTLLAGSLTTTYTHDQLFDITFAQLGDVVTLAHNSHPPRELRRELIAGNTRSGINRTFIDIAPYRWAIEDISFQPEMVGDPRFIRQTGTTTGTQERSYVVTAISRVAFEETQPGTFESTTANWTVDKTTGTTGDIRFTNPTSTVNSRTNAVTLNVAQGFFQVNDIVNIAIFGTGGTVFDLETYVSSITPQTGNITEITVARTPEIDSVDTNTFANLADIRPRFIRINTDAIPTSDNPIVIEWDRAEGAIEYNIYRFEGGAYSFLGISNTNRFIDGGESVDSNDHPPMIRQSFIGARNYPTAVTYAAQRLCFANTLNQPECIEMSAIGQFKSFNIHSPIQDSDALTFRVASRDVNEVRHLLELRNLIVFTSGGVWVVQGNDAGVVTPLTINLRRHYYNGASKLLPITIGENAIYNQARGSIIRDIAYSRDTGGYSGQDLTISATHLLDNHTIVDWAYQENPDSIVWMVRDDGIVLGLTYLKEQGIVAWHQHEFSGVVESVEVVPNGREDAVYFVVRRGTIRTIEWMGTRLVDDITDYIGTDATVSTSTAGTTVTGLNHLNNEEVNVLADGYVQSNVYNPQERTLTVTSNEIVLDNTFTKIHVGLPMTADIETLDVEVPDDTLIGSGKITKRLYLFVEDSRGLWAGTSPPPTDTNRVEGLTNLPSRNIQDRVNMPPPLRNGVVELPIVSDWNDNGRIFIRQIDPLPLSILSIVRSGNYPKNKDRSN